MATLAPHRRLLLALALVATAFAAPALAAGCDPPVVVTQPHALSAFVAGDATFTGAADGTAPLAYQWRRNGAPLANDARISGADTPTLSISPLETADSGAYDVLITNACGDAASDPASLLVQCFSPSFHAQLIAADGAANDQLGTSLAASGNIVVVGAPLEDNARGSNAGSVYVWTRSGDVWLPPQKLIPAEGAANDRFGSSVAIRGDTILIGAPFASVDASNTGAAYIFVRSGAGVQQARLVAADRAAGDRFGIAVALDNNIAVIGAPFEETPPSPNDRGAAYTFTRTGSAWSEQQKLTPSDPGTGDQFGAAVAISGPTIVAGAALHDIGPYGDAGAAYVFENTTGIWTQSQALAASKPAVLASFGCAIALDADLLVIGARRDFVNEARVGAAYVFDRPPNGPWLERQRLSVGQFDDAFGAAVAITDGAVIVGAPNADPPFFPNTGVGYLFAPAGGAWAVQSSFAAPEPSLGMSFAAAVTGAAGFALFGAPLDNAGPLDAGSVYVFDFTTQPPRISDPPHPAHTCPGGSASFSIQFQDDGSPTFEWRRDGVVLKGGPTPGGSEISGQGTPMLSISGARPSDRGVYDVVVTNECGPTISAGAALDICVADWTCDAAIDSTDVSEFINDWFEDLATGTLHTDIDENAIVNSTDVSEFINEWFEAVASGC